MKLNKQTLNFPFFRVLLRIHFYYFLSTAFFKPFIFLTLSLLEIMFRFFRNPLISLTRTVFTNKITSFSPLPKHYSPITPIFNNPNSLQSQNLTTFPNKQTKSDLKHAFLSAKTLGEMFTALKHFESFCENKQDVDLGIAYAYLAQKIYLDDQEHVSNADTVLFYGKKALLILASYENTSNICVDYSHLSVIILRNLLVMGIACSRLKMFDESLAYLNRASKFGDRLLAVIEDRRDVSVLSAICSVENELFNVKMAMGVADEILVMHIRKCVEIHEKYADEYDVNLGYRSFTVANGYARVFEFGKALPFCLKALKIFTKNFGQDSLKVVEVRRLLGTIYGSLGEYDKALEQQDLSMRILKKSDPGSVGLVEEEIRSAQYQVVRGRYEDGIATLKALGPRTIKDKVLRATAFLTMAQGYYGLGKFADAKRCAEISGRIYAEKENQVEFAGYVAKILKDLAIVYMEMKEPETALSYLERVLMMTEKLSLTLLVIVMSRYNSLMWSTGKLEEGIPYLEVVVRRLKESFGANHVQVGIAYLHLGYALLALRKPQRAADCFKDSIVIMDASIGPYHDNSIKACQGLAKAYSDMGSYHEAVKS